MMADGARELTRREALRAGGAAAVVLGTVAGCDARPAGVGRRDVNAGEVSVFPLPGTPTASPNTSISFRDAGRDALGTVTVEGSRTGRHRGAFHPHPDGRGAVFVPSRAFDPGETVTVRSEARVRGVADGRLRFGVARPVESQRTPQSREAGERRVRTFASRPDLRPPELEVRQPGDSGLASGYVFVAPKKWDEDTTQEGPMIVDNRGEVVWFHPLQPGTYAMNFQVQTYRGKDVLTWWEGHAARGYGVGEYVIADDRYREATRVRAGNGYSGDLHAFRITPHDTALLTIFSRVRWDTPGGGQGSGDQARGGQGDERSSAVDSVIDGIFQEVDIETGMVLFEWHTLGNIALDESYGDVIADPAGVVDYLHPNSIDVDHDGHFLLSGRHTRTLYKIDRRTGDVIWRLGGKNSDVTLGRGAHFAYQHDAQRQPDGTITMFDNAAGSAETAVRDTSRGIVLELDTDAMTATLVREYAHPAGTLSESQGNMQTLPNGNVFIGWGSEPLFTEHSEDGVMLLDVRFPPEVDSYRAFRFPWTGRPADKPAVAVESAGPDTLAVAASWNGATDVATWQVLAGADDDRLRPVARRRRDGFETRITVPVAGSHVAVQALDGSGQALGTSETVRIDD